VTPTLVAFFALASSATPAPGWCPNRAYERGHLRVSSHWHANLGKCSVSVGPRDALAPSRALTFSGDGRLMVFDTYEPVDDAGNVLESDDPAYAQCNTFTRVTGARVFWVFPRTGELEVLMARERVTVVLPNGASIGFDTETGAVVATDGMEVRQAESVERGQQGGTGLTKFDGLVLDSGFRLGADPTTAKAGTSVIRDAYGGRCALPNRVAYRYDDGDPRLRFETDAEMLRYLRRLKQTTKKPACRALRLKGLSRSLAGR
jgi:hypothetical protein